jgi:hypothetical protein
VARFVNLFFAVYGAITWCSIGLGGAIAACLVLVERPADLVDLGARILAGLVVALWFRFAGGLFFGIAVVAVARAVYHGGGKPVIPPGAERLHNVFVQHGRTHRLLCRLLGESFDDIAAALKDAASASSPATGLADRAEIESARGRRVNRLSAMGWLTLALSWLIYLAKPGLWALTDGFSVLAIVLAFADRRQRNCLSPFVRLVMSSMVLLGNHL